MFATLMTCRETWKLNFDSFTSGTLKGFMKGPFCNLLTNDTFDRQAILSCFREMFSIQLQVWKPNLWEYSSCVWHQSASVGADSSRFVTTSGKAQPLAYPTMK